MKPFHQVLLATTALGLGYALGMKHYGRPEMAARSVTFPVKEAKVASVTGSPREEAVATVISALLGRGDFRELARSSPLLDALDSEQMRALMEQVDGMPERDRNVLLPRLLAYWTRRDPNGATEWMQPHLAKYVRRPTFASLFANFDTNFVEAWAENAPELAFAFARQHSGTDLAAKILHDAILSWPGKDSARAFEALMTYPPGKERANVLASLAYTWAYTDRDAALASVAALPPGSEREGALGEILASLAESDPVAAFEKAAAHDLKNPSWLAVLVKEAARKDPATAIAWLKEQDPETFAQIGPIAVCEWARKDPTAAFAWAQEHGISLTETGSRRALELPGGFFGRHVSDIGWNSPFTAAMQAKPEATLAWVRTLPAGPERERYLEIAIRNAQDIESVKPLLQELSPDAADRAAAMIALRLADKDPDESRQWAESLPPGSARDAAWTALGANRTEPLELPPGRDRDAMLSGMANSLSRSTPVKALEWVLEIGDPQLRRRTFDDVMWRLTRGRIDYSLRAYTPGASEATLQRVREWLSGSDIPAEWRNAWRL